MIPVGLNGNGKVHGDQRYSPSNPCPICHGHEDMRRGAGERCTGYLSDVEGLCFCSRVESGALKTRETPVGTVYLHKVPGHVSGAAAPAPEPAKKKREWGYGSPQDAARNLGKKAGTIAASYVYKDADGLSVLIVYRFLGEGGKKTFRPVHRRKDGKWYVGDPAGLMPLYHLPELLDDLVVVSEGEKAADAVRALGFQSTTSVHGSHGVSKADWSPLAGKRVVILPDNDQPGEEYAAGVVHHLARLDPAPSVSIIRLPGLPPKGDAVEWIEAGGTAAQLQELIDDATPVEPAQEDIPRPVVLIGSEDQGEGFKRWTPQALEALVALNATRPHPAVFRRGVHLVRVRPAEDEETPTLEPYGADSLRGLLDRAADWGTAYRNKKGELQISYGPPRADVVKDILALDSYEGRFPALDQVVESPRFLPDGTLIVEPGYHQQGRVFYSPTPDLAGLSIPERPAPADLDLARSLIMGELLADFPFANQAAKANAVALMLLPFARLLIDGPTPLHHVEASTEGTGKGLLVQALLMAALGHEATATPPKEDDAEFRKLLGAQFDKGASYIFLDNLATGFDRFTHDELPVDSPSLASALTASRYEDRKLGGSTMINVTVRAIFASTGNNTVFSRELTRRIVPIPLITPCEDPSSREGFRHEDLLAWAKERRRDLAWAALVLIRNWFVMGKPAGTRKMGSYEKYARVMGGILTAAGIEGFLTNRKAGGRNRETIRWVALTAEWRRQHGTKPIRARELADLLEHNSDLNEAFADLVGDGSAKQKAMRVGRALSRNVNRVYGEWRIVEAGEDRTVKVGLFKLQSPGKGLDLLWGDDEDTSEANQQSGEDGTTWQPY